MIVVSDIEQAYLLANLIPEFSNEFDYGEMVARIGERKYLSMVYIVDGTPVAFKIGYELNVNEFYSWLGGVIPAYRGRGIAKQLLLKQEAWARERGYSRIRVKSTNDFPNMLCLLISNGYKIDSLSNQHSPKDLKIHFSKGL